MIFLKHTYLNTSKPDGEVSALNGIWIGDIKNTQQLPQLGHIFIVFPLGDARISCAGKIITQEHYLLLTKPSDIGYTLQNLHPHQQPARVLLLMLSQGFLGEMANFLGINPNLENLLHGIPLTSGDHLSQALTHLIATQHDSTTHDEIFMDIVAQLLQLLRYRQQALTNLAQHKAQTAQDIVTLLLEARQFIEAHYLQPLKNSHVADHIALSEYHFVRLFKTAFETTVHQYLMGLRLSHACYLLEASHMRITDISLELGYNSLSAFNRAFKGYTGVSPSKYRKRVQKN